MTKRPTYTEEFKDGAVRLSLDSDKNLAEVARELGISEASLVKWRKERNISAARGGSSEIRALREELEETRRQLKQMEKEKKLAEMEREILKKAAAFFAKHQA